MFESAAGDTPSGPPHASLARASLADRLREAVPGVELVRILAALDLGDVDDLGDVNDLGDVDDATLVEAMAGWERVAAWGASRQAALVSELRRRREPQGCVAYLGDEIAARLACTRHAGDQRLGLAVGLERLPAVADALATGLIDVRKATVIVEDLLHVPEPSAQAAASAVLVDAPTMTAPQVRARLRRLEIDRDPDGAATRHERARKERHVELTPTSDSMAWLAAWLPADDAVSIYTALTAIAGTAAPDDPRPLGARRADALVDLATHWLDAGLCPDGPLPLRQGRRPHLSLTASASTVLGLDDAPADLAGYGPIPAPMARRIAARSTWTPLLVDARTGQPLARSTQRYEPTAGLRGAVVDRDITCVFPGCRLPAERCDIDHVRPFTGVPSPGVPSPGEAPETTEPQTSVDNLQALCRHHHLAKTHGSWSVARDVDEGSTRWRSPTGHWYERPAATSPPRRFLASPPPGVRIDVAGPRGRGRPPSRHGPLSSRPPDGEPLREVGDAVDPPF